MSQIKSRTIKILSVLVLALGFSTTYAAPAPNIKLQINGKSQVLDQPFTIEKGRVFLPVEKLEGLLGVKISDNIKLGKEYLPVRSISENLGFQVAYDKGTVSIITNYKNSLTYSNLVDQNTQDQVKKTMELAGFLAENIDSFFQDVNSYNNIVEEKSLVKDGFTTITSLEPEYDLLAMIDMWDAKSPEFIGYNCRIISYDLMKDSVHIGKPDTANSSELAFDKNALETSPKKLFNKAQEEEFLTLYSYIPTDATKDISVHVENIKKDWKAKEIQFANKDKRSLVSVFFHAEEGYLFIGHMGVLIPTEDGKLLFLEKLSFQEPYQAIKFANRTELNDYLMNKYDLSWGQPTAKPFIMENDQLLDGYRESLKNSEGGENDI